jgi:peptide deformylase
MFQKMKKLQIVTYPNQVLSTPAKKVSLPLLAQDQALIRAMFATVDGDGIGLAAPQVNASKQICIIYLDPDLAERKDKHLHFVMINPEISFYSQTRNQMIEGCLSFPKQYWEIIRPANINVEFDTIANLEEFLSDETSEPILVKRTIKAGGWMSRVIQHEVDHLNGKLFIDMGGRKVSQKELMQNEYVE